MTNLILSKIQDEDEKEDGDTYDFQSLTFAKDGDEEFETNEQLLKLMNSSLIESMSFIVVRSNQSFISLMRMS